MMLYPSMAELLEKVDSRYMLVNVIAKRAREISSEAEETKDFLDEKSVSLAIKEIADGRITVGKRDDQELEEVGGESVETHEEAEAEGLIEPETEVEPEVEVEIEADTEEPAEDEPAVEEAE